MWCTVNSQIATVRSKECLVRDKHVHVRMKVHQIAERLNEQHQPWPAIGQRDCKVIFVGDAAMSPCPARRGIVPFEAPGLPEIIAGNARIP